MYHMSVDIVRAWTENGFSTCHLAFKAFAQAFGKSFCCSKCAQKPDEKVCHRETTNELYISSINLFIKRRKEGEAFTKPKVMLL